MVCCLGSRKSLLSSLMMRLPSTSCDVQHHPAGVTSKGIIGHNQTSEILPTITYLLGLFSGVCFSGHDGEYLFRIKLTYEGGGEFGERRRAICVRD